MKLIHIKSEHGLASFNIFFPYGSLNCPSISADLHLIEHLIFHGHPNMRYHEIMSFFEEEGGFINASVEESHTFIYGRINSSKVNDCINILLDCIIHFSIDYSDYMREINNIKEELKYTSINAHIIEEVNRCVFSIVQKNKCEFLNFDELIDLERRIFRAEDALIVIVSNGIISNDFSSAVDISLNGFIPELELKRPNVDLLAEKTFFLQPGKVRYCAYTSYCDGQSHNGIDLVVHKAALTEGFTSLIRRETRNLYGIEPYRLFFYKNQIYPKANCSIIFTPDTVAADIQERAFIHEIIMSHMRTQSELKKIAQKATSMLDIVFENIGIGAKFICEYLPLDICDNQQYNEIKIWLQQMLTPQNVDTWLDAYSKASHHAEIHSVEKTVLHKTDTT